MMRWAVIYPMLFLGGVAIGLTLVAFGVIHS